METTRAFHIHQHLDLYLNGTHITVPAGIGIDSTFITEVRPHQTDAIIQVESPSNRSGLTTKDFSRVGVGAGDSFVAALQHHSIVCGMTSQPTVTAIEKKGLGYSAVDLATTAGVNKWLGGPMPTAGILALNWIDSHQDETQRVVNALVATMHWISTHTAAQIAAKMPPDFVSNALTSKADYIGALATDKGQFLPDGLMPKGGPAKVYEVTKAAGKLTKPVNVTTTYTNKYAIKANKLEGFTK